MTHPFHPLHGRTFEVVDRRFFQDAEYVYLEVGAGPARRLPAAWTSLGPADLVLMTSAGRSMFRADDLVRLATLIDEIEGTTQSLERQGEAQTQEPA